MEGFFLSQQALRNYSAIPFSPMLNKPSPWPAVPLSQMKYYCVPALLALFLYFLLTRVFLRYNLADSKGHVIPPGPWRRFACLPKYSEQIIHNWAQKFGPIMSVWMGNQLFVVLNDPHVIRDLLIFNGANFSNRWTYFVKNQTVLKGGSVTSTRYSETWKQHRRIAMGLLTPHAIQGYTPVLEYESTIMVRNIWEESKNGKAPVNPFLHVGRYALNNVLQVTLGTRTTSVSDPIAHRALALGLEFMELSGPWSNAIDFIKPLQWMPTKTRSRARALHAGFLEVFGGMLTNIKLKLENGTDVRDCFGKELIECQEKENLSWEDMTMIVNAFTTGGVPSTAAAIQWLIALMPFYPEVMAKAHEELDRVIGCAQWPSVEDECRLPYIRAMIKELLRLQTPFWMGSPHCSDEDFVYNGMFIPANTVIITNCYTIHHNEERYPDSFRFNPDRYLNDELSISDSSKISTNVMERDHWTFGAGRRICPGIPLVEKELYLAISRILWSFSIEAHPQHEIKLDEHIGYSGRTPVPFKVNFVPRHERVKDMFDTEEETIL